MLRSVEVNQQVYITLRQQYELAKIEELKEKPVINILDKAKPAAKKSKPKRVLIVLLTIVTSFFGSIYFIYLQNRLKFTK